MSALVFPNQNVLRLVLANGLAPAELAGAPAAAGVDRQGRIWFDLPELPAREVLAGLARVGVQVLGGTDVPTETVRGWAELLSLRSSSSIPSGTVLFIGPDRQAAGFVGRIRRSSRGGIGVALRDSPSPQQAWIAVRHPSPLALARASEIDAAFEAFYEQAPRIWVRAGWEHPLPEMLPVPPDGLLLLRSPRSVTFAAATIPPVDGDEFALPFVRQKAIESPASPVAFGIRLYLAPRAEPAGETLWVLEDDAAAEFWRLCAAVDERLLRRLSAASFGAGPAARLVVQGPEGRGTPTFLPIARIGYAPDPRLPDLFVPANRELRPHLRPRELAAALGLKNSEIAWLEPQPDGSVMPRSAPRLAFRPLSDLIEYSAEPNVSLVPEFRSDAFALARFVLTPETLPAAELPLVITEEMEEPAALAPPEPAWYVRTFRKLFGRKSRVPADEELEPETPARPALPTDSRMEQTLASPEAIRHGPDWAARRRELEAGLFMELPRLGAEGRASRWATLASVYAKMGNPADAAVCWLNAVWETSAPQLSWLHQWLAAECQAAKLTDVDHGLDRWLGERPPGVGRVIAAYATVAGHTQSAAEYLPALPRILAFLDQQFDELPLRSAWLARLSAARVCDGDALGLARWHDRLLARLGDRGPGLDLDEPSFLRFHGNVSSERFQAARKCLESVREKVHGWIHRHARPGRRLASDRLLQWAGIIAEKDATSAYADFMLAWGLGCLGERIQASTWAARARKRLLAASGSGVDPAVHGVLADLFLLRVKDAHEGRPPKPGLPTDLQRRLESLADYPHRYAVDRLREHSRILEPLDQARAYRGRDLKGFWGNDRLGERLFLLADRTDPRQLADEAASLLNLCTESPTTETVPRVVLTLLEIAPRLDPAVQVRALDLAPTALDWMEAWLASAPVGVRELQERLSRYRLRMIRTSFAAAAALDPALASPAAGRLVQYLRQFGSLVRDPLLDIAPQVFRALRRLGLKNEAESLARFLDPGRDGLAGKASLPARLGLAAGWFTVGDEDAGYNILNEAHDQLYLARELDARGRTELALAYAETLGFAPPRIAHGRLGELFERLGCVTVSGSVNLYYTLQPLQLVDVVVRSVVTDEFALGPAVRSWLDDDEFLIRGRIHRDLAAVLREQGMG